MAPDAGFNPDAPPPTPHPEALEQDLALGPIIAAMAAGDPVIERVARAALITAPATDPAQTRYRQAVLDDARRYPAMIRRLYEHTCLALGGRRQGLNARLSTVVIRHAANQLSAYVDGLSRMREELAACGEGLESAGLATLAADLDAYLNAEAVATMKAHLRALRRGRAHLVSARLGPGNKAVGYRLRRRESSGGGRWLRRLAGRRDGYRLHIDHDDERYRTALRAFRDERLAPLSQTLKGIAQQTEATLVQLRDELAFYLGCLNLENELAGLGVAMTVPEVAAYEAGHWQGRDMVDVALALTARREVVGNDLAADDCLTVVITGANRGGKSTFLRGLGQAQLMAQAGCAVGAASLRLSARDVVLTHFPRGEDAELRHGKLDEELVRLSQCIDALTPRALLLSNESCAVTNQREGATIMADVAAPLHDYGARAVYVTHLYELAATIRDWETSRRLMLRAERGPEGQRRFRVVPGDPESSSHAMDLYAAIIEDSASSSVRGADY